jgi:hypothetical protein
MTRTVTKLAVAVAIALGVAGCVYEPAPYYAPAPAYYGSYPAYGAYYGPSVSLSYRGGGDGWRHWHGRD